MVNSQSVATRFGAPGRDKGNGDPAAAFALFLEGGRDEGGVVAAKTERVI